MCVYACVCACVHVCVFVCVTYGDTLVFRDMYALSVAYIYGIKGHALNPTPVYKDTLQCSNWSHLRSVVMSNHHVHDFFQCMFAYSHRCNEK